MKRIALALSTLSLGLYSCTNGGGQAVHHTDLELDTITYHELFTLGNSSEEQKLEVGIRYIYPQNDSLVARRLAITFFPDSLVFTDYDSPDSLMARYSEIIYNDFAREGIQEVASSRECFGHNWSLEESNDITYHDKYIFSNIFRKYNFFGGAHGIESLSALSIDRSTGLHLQESDLFVEGYEVELSQIIVSRLMAQHGISTAQELSEYGYFDPSEITPNNNFYLTDTDMIYIFNTYEIAPYANGRIEVKIPFDLLGRLIRTGSILEHYI